MGVMSILSVNEAVDFNRLKEMLQITDGNLASHINTLEKNNYLKVRKKFVGKKTNTTYEMTEKGRKAFAAHLDALEQLIKKS
jgi:DNA-binding MarR family transcriptional regulator